MEIKEYEAIRTQEDSIRLNDSDVKYTFAFEKGTFEAGTEITAFSYVSGEENASEMSKDIREFIRK